MADTRIWVTDQFTRRNSQARIECLRCNHVVIVSGAIIDRMFRQPISVSIAEKKLVCTKCGGRGARIVTIAPRGR